jgi:HK97 family phage major capsid protein
MKFATVDEVQRDLQRLADQVGTANFPRAKRVYMDKVAVVDENGTPLSEDELEIVLMPKAAAEDQEDAEMKMEDEEDKEDKAEMEEDEDKKAAAKSAPMPRRKAVSTHAKAAVPSIGRPRVWGSLKHFQDNANGYAVEKAMRFGHWLLAGYGHRKSLAFCERHGITVKAHTEGINSAGGYLVPDEFETELITLREQFGVFRQYARVRPMTSDTLRIPRRKSGLSAYFVGEASAITESTQTFEQVNLIAKKLGVLTTISAELNEDAFVNLADDVAGEIAYEFAKKEDQCGFIGDGTSTYGGIRGVVPTLEAGSAGIQFSTTAAGRDNASSLTIAEISEFMSLLPAYADTSRTALFMHKSTYHAGFERQFATAGGTSGREYAAGFGGPTFLGYPVVFTQTMTNAAVDLTADGIVALFGDLSLAASFGDRRSTSIQLSDSATVGGGNVFEQDEIAVRGTERFDINVHDTGSSTESGPIVGLKFDYA